MPPPANLVRCEMTDKKSLEKVFMDAENWKCTECGAFCDPVSADWRWNGERWEHHHDYPVEDYPLGHHFPAEQGA